MNIKEDHFKEIWMNAEENKDYIPVNTKWYNLEEVKYWKNYHKQLEIKVLREKGLGWLIDFCSNYKEEKNEPYKSKD